MDHLGASVHIRQKNSGAGEVVIKYASLEELDGVLGGSTFRSDISINAIEWH